MDELTKPLEDAWLFPLGRLGASSLALGFSTCQALSFAGFILLVGALSFLKGFLSLRERVRRSDFAALTRTRRAPNTINGASQVALRDIEPVKTQYWDLLSWEIVEVKIFRHEIVLAIEQR